MAFGAHPDDIDFGCSMYIRNLIQKGYKAYYVVMTNGENGFKVKKLKKSERIKIRKIEQIDSSKKIGVDKVFFLNLRDGFLEYTDILRKKITILIKKFKPSLVFSFDPSNKSFSNINLHHRDHRVISEVVFDSVFAAKNQFIYPFKTETHKVDKIYFFGTDKPNFYFDITKEINIKMDILSSFRSQFPDFKSFSDFFKKNIAANGGKYKYSEAFRILDVVQINY